jgi:CobQ-like glutamine amidotransferase family enzyme
VSATVVAPSGAGTAVGPISGADMVDTTIDALMYNAQGSKAFSYTMVVGNNVSTSGDPSMVGADADLYIGSVQNVVVTPMSTIRAVTKKMYYEMIARQGLGVMPSEVAKWDTYGTVVKIAGGVDEKGDSVFLIRDVALGYGPKIQSNFIYSQKQLLTQIIPAKAKEIVDMMYLGTKDEAQTIADKTGQPVYLSLRLPTDSLFAVVNRPILGRKDLTTLNDSIDVAGDGINYLMVLPSGKPRTDFSDEVSQKYYVIKAWADMIARNEHEKLSANDLLTNYDVAGAAGVNYSETFDTNYSNSFTHHFPVATEVDYFGLGAGVSNAASAVSIGASIASAIAISLKEMKKWTTPSAELALIDDENGMKSQVTFAGKLFKWTVFPIISYTTIGTNSQTKAYNRTESFTIALDPYSHLSVDVYRAKLIQSSSGQTVTASNIFTNDNFFTYYNDVYEQVKKDLKADGIDGPRSFIFRTRGGSTQNPWEDQRVTTLYRPGAELDARTLKIVNPKIRLDKQSVSGVSVNDPAIFTIYVSNESEKPEATEGLTVLQLFAVDQMNPLGAWISVNNMIYIGNGSRESQELARTDLLKYKYQIKKSFKNQLILATGNAMELFGASIDNKECLNLIPIKTLYLKDYVVQEKIIDTEFINKPIIGFINRNSESKIKKNYFLNEDGIHVDNFYGTYLLGPLLIRNPYLLNKFMEILFSQNDMKIKSDYKNVDILAYNEYLKNFKK